MGLAERSRGSTLGYRLLGLLFRLCGYRVVAAFTRMIVFYYFWAARRARRTSVAFYAALFPDEPPTAHRRRAFAQFASFSTVFLDRFLIARGEQRRFVTVHEGLDQLVVAARERRPLVLWMSHLGNWEVACHGLEALGVPLTLILGRHAGEHIEALQKAELERRGVRVLYVREGDSLGTLEAVQTLRAGGLVAISGDRLFDARQRSIEIEFLGRPCRVPLGPYALALAGRAAIVPFFGLRTGPLAYRFVALAPRDVENRPRAERDAAFRDAAQRCFDDMSFLLKTYPEQWYNFYDYWA